MADEAAALVLLPGMNCSARLWAGVEAPEAIVPVLSEPTVSGQVERLLDELPARFRLVGLSLGAIVAMALIRTAPERVERLGLLSTNPDRPTEEWRTTWLEHRHRLATGATPAEIQADLVPMLLSPGARVDRPDLVETTLRMGDDVGAGRLDQQLAMQATRIDERPFLADVGCPTIVIAARWDAMCPVGRHVEIAALIPGARLEVIETAGHLSPLEQPVAVAGLLRQAGLG